MRIEAANGAFERDCEAGPRPVRLRQASDLRPEPEQTSRNLRSADEIVLRPRFQKKERGQPGLAKNELPVRVANDFEIAGDDNPLALGESWNPDFIRLFMPPEIFEACNFIAIGEYEVPESPSEMRREVMVEDESHAAARLRSNSKASTTDASLTSNQSATAWVLPWAWKD